MLLYEIWSVGHKPFYNYKNHEVLIIVTGAKSFTLSIKGS